MLTPIYSVGEAGAIFLLISPSAYLTSMGHTGVSIPTNDIYSSFFNPANPTIPKGISFQYSGYKMKWLPNLADDLDEFYEMYTIGYYLEKYQIKLTYSKFNNLLDLGEQTRTDEYGNELYTFESSMETEATSYSIGIKLKKYPLSISIGRTNKIATQDLIDIGTGAEAGSGWSVDKFYDWGYLLTYKYEINQDSKDYVIDIAPSIGYSKANIGGEIIFIDPNQADPSPRYARFGASAIFSIKSNEGIELLTFTTAREASDLLVEVIYDSTTQFWDKSYQSGLGDIDIKKHLILSEADKDITIHRGIEFEILGMYSIRSGRFIDEDGQTNLKTRGRGFNIKGLFKLMTYLTGNSTYNNISEYINFRYNTSRETGGIGHPRDNTKYREFTFTFNYLFE